jgi:hypothetical protein
MPVFCAARRFIAVSQEPATGLCLEPHGSRPHYHTFYFLETSFNIILVYTPVPTAQTPRFARKEIRVDNNSVGGVAVDGRRM